MPVDSVSGIYYEVNGEGPPLLVTLPLMASHASIFSAAGQAIYDAWIHALIPGYRVLLVDYPSIGRSRDVPPEALTADRVCQDLLTVATAAGFDRFAYCGYSWSGAVGLQLAARTDRLTALLIGGWTPLGGPYMEILEVTRRKTGNVEKGAMVVLRSADQYRQWTTYYQSMIDWNEQDAVAAITCPKFLFYGAEGDLVEAGIPIAIASINRAHRQTLERLGWSIVEFPDAGHDVVTRPVVMGPIRAFLDGALRGDDAQ